MYKTNSLIEGYTQVMDSLQKLAKHNLNLIN